MLLDSGRRLFGPQVGAFPQRGQFQGNILLFHVPFQEGSGVVRLFFSERREGDVSIEDIVIDGQADVLQGLAVTNQKNPLNRSVFSHNSSKN